ncbi:hypothetical protein GCM10007907_11070 [Chitinimonas prasina]|uniref:Thioredoxin domain-containing protein n=1 Tax=Chitinimonas prasina TaxID=1434937 RepID=A0ABQ5YBI5_9NEIS|nr:TlpA disulfide reductase family protein [Chitinimonas prasina]GLR12317.1 hypothetical protein GCM10007907_11070 [Chitinimonas prasina]
MKPLVKLGLGLAIAGAIATFFFADNLGRSAAPAVQYTSLKGEQLSQASLKGKVVLVNFWYPSCVGCVSETPKLVATHHKFKGRDFATVGVTMNIDPPQVINAFAERFQIPYFIALDIDGSIAQRFGDVRLAPTSFLIDKQGRIVRRYLGEPDFEQLHALIEEKLKES